MEHKKSFWVTLQWALVIIVITNLYAIHNRIVTLAELSAYLKGASLCISPKTFIEPKSKNPFLPRA